MCTFNDSYLYLGYVCFLQSQISRIFLNLNYSSNDVCYIHVLFNAPISVLQTPAIPQSPRIAMGLLCIPTSSSAVPTFFLICCALFVSQALGARTLEPQSSLPFIWPLPEKFIFGNETLSVDPAISISLSGNGAASNIVREAFERYKGILFEHGDRFRFLRTLNPVYDVNKMIVIVHSNSEEVGFFFFNFVFALWVFMKF